MPQTLLRIPERGTVEISKSLWSTLATESQFWSLVDRGIVYVERSSATVFRLRGGPFVGRAIIGGQIALQLEEKVSGSLVALIRYASHTDFRIQLAPSQVSDIGPLISLLADQFTQSVTRYLSRGREFNYRTERHVGALIGGKLHMTGTIRLRVRGLSHLAEFEKSAIAFDTSLNQIILAALRELERINRLVPLEISMLAKARSLSLLFSDCRSKQVLFGARAEFIRLAAASHVIYSDPLIRDLTALSGILLSHESFEPSAARQNRAPRSWFLNLESLFELSTRNILTRMIGNAGSVQNGRNAPALIFKTGDAHYRAHPDFVLRTGGPTTVVGDAKFKLPNTTVEPSDLYQLIVHASAFDATEAFLLYPDDSFQSADLGVTNTGIRVRSFTVDLRNLPASLMQLLTLVAPGIMPNGLHPAQHSTGAVPDQGSVAAERISAA
jgi:5-methylcytosine-specific restriction endonuclease McrBC regulatory subunit McrC